MKYTPATIENTYFHLRRVAVRPKEDQINEIGSVQILTPADGAVSVAVDGEITWDAVDGFSRYRIIITLQSNGSEVVNEVVSGTSYTPSFNATTGYDIQVKTARRIAQAQSSSVTGVSITGGNSLEQNGTTQLEISVSGSGNYSQSVNLSSSNEAIATVNSSGLVTYVSGSIDATVDITATSAQDPSKSATQTLTIIATSAYVAQDSRAGDEAFMQALWDATQGDNIESVANEAELENVEINRFQSESETGNFANSLEKRKIGDILYVHQYGVWVNKGRIWFNREGWVDGAMDLSAPNITGIEVATVNGELRIVNFDMAKEVLDYENNPELATDNFALGGNNLVGTLPPEWGNLTKCKQFNVKQNHFTDEIPDTLQPGNLLEKVQLGGQKGEYILEPGNSYYSWTHSGRTADGEYNNNMGGKRFEWTNEFVSALPVSLRHSLNIDLIEIRMQYLTGDLPAEWSVLRPRGIFLDNPKGEDCLGGPLPPEWGDMGASIRVLRLNRDGNYSGRFHVGNIPDSWNNNWTEIFVFNVERNDLTGNQPSFPFSTNKRYYDTQNNFFDPTQTADQFFTDFFKDGKSGFINVFRIMPLAGDLPELPLADRSDGNTHYNFAIFNISGHGYTGALPQWLLNIRPIQLRIESNDFSTGFPKELAEYTRMRVFSISDMSDGAPTTLPDVLFSPAMTAMKADSNGYIDGFPDSWSSASTNNAKINWWTIEDNELSDVLPLWFSQMDVLEWLWLRNNRFTYSHILPNYDAIKQNIIDNHVANGRWSSPRFLINSQKPFLVPQQDYTFTVGQTVTVDLSSIDYLNNVYQWYKDGSPVSGQTAPTLSIPNAQTTDSGIYYLRITNEDLNQDPTYELIQGLDESLSQEITITIT